MNTFEQDMAESYKKLENSMETIASLFNWKSRFYMGENIMILDFNTQEFMQAQATASTWLPTGDHGWTNHEGIKFRPVLYSKKNRIALTF